MQKINEVQLLNSEDLLFLLTDCSRYLMDAYQELEKPHFWETAQKVHFACDYLKYKIFKENGDFVLH